MFRRRSLLAQALTVVLVGAAVSGLWRSVDALASSAADEAAELLKQTGVTGGLVVHLGCGEGRLTVELCRGPGFLVLGLDRNWNHVQAGRRYAQSRGVYGQVSVDHWDGRHIPLVSESVNLLVVEERGECPKEELLRVLRPGGVLCVRAAEGWSTQTKPWPKTIDQWTHYLHDPTNNAVAHDQRVGPPRHLQWVGSPRYSRHHDRLSSVPAVVSAGGRVFYIVDEAPRVSVLLPAEWKLVARDAFNGVVLWKRRIEKWWTHLWPLKSGPAQLPRRLVATPDRVFVTLRIDGPVTALDAATGKTLRVYEGTRATEEILYSDGVLFLLVDPSPEQTDYQGWQRFRQGYRAKAWDGRPRRLLAVDADTGRVLWQREQTVLPVTLAVDQKRVVFHDGQCIVALDRKTGQQLWRSRPVPRAAEIMTFYAPTLVLYQDVVLFSGGETAGLQTGSWYESGKDTMTALSAETGEVLWTAYHPPSGYRSPEDLLVAGGLVWTGETTSGRARGLFTGRDPHTGEVKVQFTPDVQTYWFHHRCYRGKATDRYLLMSRAGIEFVDIRRQHWDVNHWVRGACLYGVMPANGLVYAPQHPCACYLEAKLVGLNALATDDPAWKVEDVPQSERLERGPAYGKVEPTPASPEDWPTYRHDEARSGRASTSVPADLQPLWQAELGGRLSSPVAANGRVFVAGVDAHTLYAFDAQTGRQQWSFTAGGRIDSPPTLYQGLVLFGSADGYVYALRQSDGQLVWRFLAGRAERRAVAFEQLESLWPVHGSVLVHDGVVWCVAGRSMFLDGGLRLWRLDAKTGQPLGVTVLDDKDRASGKSLLDYVSWLNMPPALPDILSCDGRFVYMRSQPFRLDGTRPPLRPMPRRPDADRGAPPPVQNPQYAHLFSPTGFLDDSGWHRTYWLYGSTFVSGWQGYYLAGKAAPAGKILVFDEHHVYGYGRRPKYYRWTTPLEHQLFATSKKLPKLSVPQEEDRPTLVRVPKSESLNPAGQPLTVAAWVDSRRPNGVALAHGGGVQGYALYVQNGQPCFAVRVDGKLTVVSSDVRITDRWAHLVGVLTADKQLQLYVDGQLAAQKKVESLIAKDPVEGLTIGRDERTAVGDYESPLGLYGWVDEVRLYHRALSPTEVAQLASGRPVSDQSLVLAFSFERGQAKDSSGHGNDGQVVNATVGKGKVGQCLWFGGRGGVPADFVVEREWTLDVPLFVRALLLSDDRLFLAGPPDLVDEEKAFRNILQPSVQEKLAEQTAAYKGKKGGLLWVVSASDGKKLSELKLSSPPVFDGLAAARGRLYLTTLDGRLVCFGAK